MPRKEPDICEKRLIRVMKRLKIEDYNYNYDRISCFIQFQYQENSYRLEHSIQKAKEKGLMMLENGLDCLTGLIESLEDLCQIIERGTYKLETWLSGMKLSTLAEESPEFLEEVHIKYKPLGKQNLSGYNRDEELIHAASESSLGVFDRNHIIQRSQSK